MMGIERQIKQLLLHIDEFNEEKQRFLFFIFLTRPFKKKKYILYPQKETSHIFDDNN